MENRSWLFDPVATCRCLVHKQSCQVYPSIDAFEQPAKFRRISAELPRELSVHVAGVTCVGWTSEGKREGFGHISEAAHAVYVAERRFLAEERREHVFFNECVPAYPAGRLRDVLPDHH
eukprot:13402673-Alexandrium_andersonii.AAC.1